MFSKTLTLLLLSSVSTSLLASTVPSSSGTYNGHYYEVYTFTSDWRLDWVSAKAFAETLSYQGGNGYLATITSQGEDDFLWNDLHSEGAFLGASKQNNVWNWVSGEAFGYTNWVPGEPNNWNDGFAGTPDNEDYLMYWSKSIDGGRWNDTNIDSSFKTSADGPLNYTTQGFVVEYAPKAVPLPAAAWLFAPGLLGLLSRKKRSA